MDKQIQDTLKNDVNIDERSRILLGPSSEKYNHPHLHQIVMHYFPSYLILILIGLGLGLGQNVVTFSRYAISAMLTFGHS